MKKRPGLTSGRFLRPVGYTGSGYRRRRLRGEDRIGTLAFTRADRAEGLDVRSGMARIFAEGFSQWLGFFSSNQEVIARAFAHMFVLDQFYVAVSEGKIAAMAACTDCKTLSVRLDGKELRRCLGWYKGTMAAIILKKEFESPMPDPLHRICGDGLRLPGEGNGLTAAGVYSGEHPLQRIRDRGGGGH